MNECIAQLFHSFFTNLIPDETKCGQSIILFECIAQLLQSSVTNIIVSEVKCCQGVILIEFIAQRLYSFTDIFVSEIKYGQGANVDECKWFYRIAAVSLNRELVQDV